MNVTNKRVKAHSTGQAHVESHHEACFFDEQGKEVKITATMIQHTCQALLKRCRTVQTIS